MNTPPSSPKSPNITKAECYMETPSDLHTNGVCPVHQASSVVVGMALQET